MNFKKVKKKEINVINNILCDAMIMFMDADDDNPFNHSYCFWILIVPFMAMSFVACLFLIFYWLSCFGDRKVMMLSILKHIYIYIYMSECIFVFRLSMICWSLHMGHSLPNRNQNRPYTQMKAQIEKSVMMMGN